MLKARKKSTSMMCLAFMQEPKKPIQKVPPPPLLLPLNTLSFLQAAISTKLVPRVLIAVYEAHLLARESVFV